MISYIYIYVYICICTYIYMYFQFILIHIHRVENPDVAHAAFGDVRLLLEPCCDLVVKRLQDLKYLWCRVYGLGCMDMNWGSEWM